MNSKFQLFVQTPNAELFTKATRARARELGIIFYRFYDSDTVKDKIIYEVVYFSGSRIVRFLGEPTPEIMKLCEAFGFEVESIQIGEVAGSVRVIQKMEA
jgi:hypothetical protein